MSGVLVISLAPMFQASSQAYADDNSSTFTVKTESVAPSARPGSPSGVGSGASTTTNQTAANQAAAAAAAETTGIAVGSKTSAGTGAKAATVKATSATAVAYVAPKSKSAKKVTVPDTVTVNGKVYKVTSISAGAFKNSNATSVIVGKNVKAIGKNAFKGAKKLKQVTLKSGKLAKGSFKNMLKGSKIKTIKLKGVSKSAKKKYVKWAETYGVKVK